jgi:arylsulfatase A-like enzyme
VRTLNDALDPKLDNVAKRMQAAGYQTSLIGKWHLKKAPSGFDYWNIIKGQGRYRQPILFEMNLDKPEVQKGKYCTDVFTDKALNWLGTRQTNKPFFLMLHFKATHEPWQFHPRHAKLYQNIDLPEPETLFSSTGPTNSRVPGWPLEILTERMLGRNDHGDGKLILKTDDPQSIRKATYQKFVKAFLRCGKAIDENIGRVLEYLDENNLSNDTVVIYTSDQGYFLGEHNYFDKRFMLEESLRMPFVIRYPREIKAGTVLEDIILNVDFAPTFLDYAGMKTPSSMQGKSARKNLLGNTAPDWRKSMYYRYFENSLARPSHYGIRTHHHKLIYYDGIDSPSEAEKWEFYDLSKDPMETRNMYDKEDNQAIIRDLKLQLHRLQIQLKDSA